MNVTILIIDIILYLYLLYVCIVYVNKKKVRYASCQNEVIYLNL